MKALLFLSVSFILVNFVAALGAAQNAYKVPPPTLDPKPYTTWTKLSGSSRLALIDVPFADPTTGESDNVHLYRLDLVGNNYDRGFAHGALMAKDIITFFAAVNKYYIQAVLKIDLSSFPEPLREILRVIQLKVARKEPVALNAALDWTYEHELAYTPR
jgi:hypothetical protein